MQKYLNILGVVRYRSFKNGNFNHRKEISVRKYRRGQKKTRPWIRRRF